MNNLAQIQEVAPNMIRGSIIRVGPRGAGLILKNYSAKNRELMIEDYGRDWVVMRDAQGKVYAGTFDKNLDAVDQLIH